MTVIFAWKMTCDRCVTVLWPSVTVVTLVKMRNPWEIVCCYTTLALCFFTKHMQDEVLIPAWPKDGFSPCIFSFCSQITRRIVCLLFRVFLPFSLSGISSLVHHSIPQASCTPEECRVRPRLVASTGGYHRHYYKTMGLVVFNFFFAD